MKNLSKVLALVLVVAMVFSFAVSAGAVTSFKDDASVNYKEAVQLLSALDVINGYDTDGDGKGDTFKPGAAITRAEVATMVSYMVANSNSENPLYSDINKLNKDYAPLCTFADSKAHWAAGFIAFCAGNGYISGRSADKFDPDATITVAEASVILLRVMGYDATIENFGTTANTIKGYNTMLTAKNAGLLSGMTNVSFFEPATREQVAQLIMNALKGYVVTYGLGNFSLVITDKDGNTSTITNTGKLYVTDEQLMGYCFHHIELLTNVATTNGRVGHQWVAYTSSTHTGAYVALTDVFVDDTVVATFNGGTPLATVVKTLGLSSKNSTVPCSVYVNGHAVTAADITAGVDLPGTAGTLNDIYADYANGLINGRPAALADNVQLTVVQDYNRFNVAGISYKLMYNFQYVADVVCVGQVNVPTSTHYGEYRYDFTYYSTWDNTKNETRSVYGAKDAYDTTAKYMVTPNMSGITADSSWEYVSNVDAFLAINAAKTAAPVKMVKGTTAVFSSNVGQTVSDGTTTYSVSAKAHDFAYGTAYAADYNKDVTVIYNDYGYVAGFAKYVPSAAETGYVYVDALEYAVTSTPSASMVQIYNGTWSAQAKALAYFPTAEGNNQSTVIDLHIVTGAAPYVDVNCANAILLTATPSSASTGEFTDKIVLSAGPTVAYYDVTGLTYPYSTENVRVFDKMYDGWYKYTKYADGTYALANVGTDSITIQKGNANLNGTYTGKKLTSATTVSTFDMDLDTMTAKINTQVGYHNIANDTYGGVNHLLKADGTTKYTYPYLGNVGGYVTVTGNFVTDVKEFTISKNVTKYAYTLYKGTAGYAPAPGYTLRFIVGGGAELLTAASTVYLTDWNGATTAMTPAELYNYLETCRTNTAFVPTTTNPGVAYELTLNEAGKIEAVKCLKVYMATKDEYQKLDNTSYVWFNGVADVTEFAPAKVWNYMTGAADPIAANDTIYYVTNNGDVASGTNKISAMWTLSVADSNINDGSWTAPGGNFQNWWTNIH